MKGLVITLLLLYACVSYSQTISYKQWNKDAKNDIRLRPKYGNIPKTEEQKNADDQLIKSYVLQEGSREKASEFLIDVGFDYLYKGEIKTAMSRFNQAWLLNPKNTDVFWGWGSIYFYFKDMSKALEQYDQGLIQNPSNSRILTDKGTIYKAKFDNDGDLSALQKAIELFSESYSIDSLNQNTSYKLSVCYFAAKDCLNALKFYEICDKLGGRPIVAGYKKALDHNCKEYIYKTPN